MKSSTKNILIAILLVIIGVLGTKLFIQNLFTKKDNSTVNSTIVVERIQKVMKLVTVEGNYSELMNYKDFDYVDFPGFRKDAIVKVNAKVSVGYNLNNMKINTDEKTKSIVISDFPQPEIISIDTDIKFENLSSGWFTSFSEAELSKLNQLAKDKIRQKALNAELIKQAEEQKQDVLDLIFYMAKDSGYKITINGILLQKEANSMVKIEN
ncbi:MAG TPA: DUF4230 domain-containing protein [Chitinophagales bacterium]|jgi:hypothetical protein|nr:DUF4230 domain-containing protein [Chitinophagales bacterium]